MIARHAALLIACTTLIAGVSGANAPMEYSFAARYAPTDSYVPGELIVRFKASHRSAALKAAAIERIGAVATQSIGNTDYVRVVLDATDDVERAIVRYQRDAAVELVQPNFRYMPQRLPNDTRFQELWALRNIGQLVPDGRYPNNPGVPGNDMGIEAAWDLGTDCSRTVIAVVDTGVNYTHLDLADNMWDGSVYGYPNHGYDFVDEDPDPMPADGDGHGTHVAGAIAAVGDNAQGTTGVCWRAQVMALRALNAGGGTTDKVIRAVRFALDKGARIINLSLGGSGYDPAFEAELEVARQRGTVVVVAAGNGAANIDISPFYPCSFAPDNIICVAALDQVYELATFSNFGSSSVDVAAPGTNTLSTWPGAFANDSFAGWLLSGGWQVSDCDFGLGPVRILSNPANWCAGAQYADNANDIAMTSYNLSGMAGAGITVSLKLTTAGDGDRFSVAYGTAGNDAFPGGFQLYDRTDSTGAVPVRLAFDLQNCLTDPCKFGFRFLSNSAGTASGASLFNLTLHRAELGSDVYAVANGTSLAAPHAAGVAALVWAYNPDYVYADVVNAVRYGGDVLPNLQAATATGRAVDAMGALRYINPPSDVTVTVR